MFKVLDTCLFVIHCNFVVAPISVMKCDFLCKQFVFRVMISLFFSMLSFGFIALVVFTEL